MFEVLPPEAVVIDGIERRYAREVDPRTAAALADRGVPVVMISFDASARLPNEDLPKFLEDHRSAFEQDGAHGPEAVLRIYGRRRGDRDDRVLTVIVTS